MGSLVSERISNNSSFERKKNLWRCGCCGCGCCGCNVVVAVMWLLWLWCGCCGCDVVGAVVVWLLW